MDYCTDKLCISHIMLEKLPQTNEGYTVAREENETVSPWFAPLIRAQQSWTRFSEADVDG